MCRGCCCGTARKHPGVDHDAIVELIGRELDGIAQVVTTECLWACDLSNVVVVNPSVEGRRAGARPAWLTEVNSVERARSLATWVRNGGPGLHEPPSELGEVRTAAGLRRISSQSW